MTRIHFVLLLGACGMLSPLAAEGPAQQVTTTFTTQKIDFAQGGTIWLKNSYGDLYVEGWDRAQVEVVVIRSSKFHAPGETPQAGKQLETVGFAVDRKSETELTISTTLPARKAWARLVRGAKTNGVAMEYRVHVPRGTNLTIDHQGGMVTVGNVTGDVNAANRHGDIMLLLPENGAYSIDAKCKMGHIASDFAGSTGKTRLLVGQHFVGKSVSPGRAIVLRSGFGGITILALPPEGAGLSTADGE